MSAEIVARLSLLSLPDAGPARISWLMSDVDAAEAVAKLKARELPASPSSAPPRTSRSIVERWFEQIHRIEPDLLISHCRSLGIKIISPDHSVWPFTDDPEPPILLFLKGNPELLAETSVAVVGTRRCSSIGRTVAYEFGSDLAKNSLPVISGLALGIDGAAHKGAIDSDGSPIGVVATGLDVVYPSQHQDLWNTVAAAGLMVSESLPGTKPQRWRFPARNRLIAALCRALVIVESHRTGGALLTVDECLERDKPTFVVPGSVKSSASAGTNTLLFEGALPCRDIADILAYLPGERKLDDVDHPTRQPSTSAGHLASLVDLIVDEVSAGPVTLDTICALAEVKMPEVIKAVRLLSDKEQVELEGSTIIVKSPIP